MFDFAWSEIAVLGVIALVVIGPKDLPRALKTAGFMVRRARMMAREFQNSVEDMVRESELQDIREQAAKAAGIHDLKEAMQDALDTTGAINTAIAEPLGGPAAHLPVTPLAVEGSAVELPSVEAAAEPALAEPAIHTQTVDVPALPEPTPLPPAPAGDHSAPAEHAPADLHRTPPAP